MNSYLRMVSAQQIFEAILKLVEFILIVITVLLHFFDLQRALLYLLFVLLQFSLGDFTKLLLEVII